jgi:hypothetical protein
VDCCVGYAVEAVKDESNAMLVPDALWACFALPAGADERVIDSLYSRILYNWLPFGSYSLAPGLPNIEIFLPNGEMTVMIPIKEKTQ